ncbi:MAG TPA: DEAD/DEAH box helicase [Xanthomonadaceae bacterium]|jgi:ATP-dependent RNA helicase DeaD
MSTDSTHAPLRFTDLGLPEPLLRALADVGYESPSPIQNATIPPLLQGRDLIGQAQTGTGKTAAFALPILARILSSPVDPRQTRPQALVLAPTRELAIQVSEAFQRYAAHLPDFHVLPIYGGQGYGPQLASLRRGVQVVVGTPGRVIDHLDRGTLDLSVLKCLVLDEADEMLRMGFIDDVETVLKKIPEQRQVVLFSATMPAQIKRIAQTYLRDPVEIAIAAKTTTAAGIRQRYWMVSGINKLDALTRILEAEPYEAMLVFARTKLGTDELAGKLAARGLSAAAINGDVPQQQRERAIQRLKDGQLDILVATDVAARGLDVERISHVLNYDIPYDTESYVHRIGRTGRAGRKGEAILFVAPRERGMLRAIERATRQPIEQMELPSIEVVNDQRIAKFLTRITDTLAGADLSLFRQLVERYESEHNVPAIEIAAALAKLVQGDLPLLLDAPSPGSRHAERQGHGESRPRWEPDQKSTVRPHKPAPQAKREDRAESRPAPNAPNAAPSRPSAASNVASVGGDLTHHHATPSAGTDASPLRIETFRPETSLTPDQPRSPGHNSAELHFDDDAPPRKAKRRPRDEPEPGMETFRIEVGHVHGVQPGNIVGAIANEADLESRYIGRIDIRDAHSLVDLPIGMPRQLLEHLKRVRVAGQTLRIHRVGAKDGADDAGDRDTPAQRPPQAKPRGDKPHPAKRKPHSPHEGKKPHRKGTSDRRR